jgi:enamine deaminase RidA (YjgF/YER057c/UK114 family)
VSDTVKRKRAPTESRASTGDSHVVPDGNLQLERNRDRPPASTMVEITGLAQKGMLVEVEVVAVIP